MRGTWILDLARQSRGLRVIQLQRLQQRDLGNRSNQASGSGGRSGSESGANRGSGSSSSSGDRNGYGPGNANQYGNVSNRNPNSNNNNSDATGNKRSSSKSGGGGVGGSVLKPDRRFGQREKSSGRGAGKGSLGNMSGASDNSSVKHDKSGHRFTLDLGNNQEAHIDYKSIGNNKLDLYHSEVPAELRGRGIGKALAKGALEQLARDKVKVRLSCSYLRNYAQQWASPDVKKLVEK